MTPLPAETHIGRVRLRVGDLQRALAFYRGVLGLNVSRDEGSTLTLGDLLVLEEHPGIARRLGIPIWLPVCQAGSFGFRTGRHEQRWSSG